MTATALRGHIQTPADPRSADAEFKAACERRDFALLQDALAGMTKREAVDHLTALFPHRSRSWHFRNFHALVALTPDDMERVLLYADPTGETAVANITRERARNGDAR